MKSKKKHVIGVLTIVFFGVNLVLAVPTVETWWKQKVLFNWWSRTLATNGLIVKYLPVFASSSTVPVITFSDFSLFCCTGDTLTATVSNLTIGESYTYEFIDLNNNGVNFTGSYEGSLLPTSNASRSISVILNMDGPESVTLIKFIVRLNGSAVAENIASICCRACS